MAEHKAKKKAVEAVRANRHKDMVEAQGLLPGELAEVVEGEEVVSATKLLHSASGSCAQYFYAWHSATILKHS